MRPTPFTSLLMLSALSCAPSGARAPETDATPAELAARALDAMGGAGALRSAVTTAEFNRATFALGQEETPQSPPRATVAFGTLIVDWAGNRRALTQESRAVNGNVTRQRQVITDRIGMNEVNGTPGPMPPAVVGGQMRALESEPHRILLAVQDAPDGATPLPAQEWRGEMRDGLRTRVGDDDVELWFDRLTGLPVVAVTVTDDGVLGDRITETWFTRWRATDGPTAITLPWQTDVIVNGRLASHTIVTALRTDPPEAASFEIPATIRQEATPAPEGAPAPPPVVVSLVELAPGVWRAEGGSHHSLVVDQGDALLVVEAPQNAGRSTAVLDTLAARFPDKPVKAVVNSHHHWDHSGGVRGVLARGVPVITHMRNVAFLEGIGQNEKSVAPDALDERSPLPAITGVTDTVITGAGGPDVHLLSLPTTHVEGILAAWVPAAKLLFVVDVLSPGATLPALGSSEVETFLTARGLDAERIVGGHGGIANRADLQAAASQR